MPADSNLIAALRREGLRAVNLGIGGSGPLAELARLREFTTSLAPRLVLWVFTEANDFDDLRTEVRNPALRRYLDASHSQHLLERHAQIESAYVARFDSALAAGGRGLGITRTRAQRLQDVTLHQMLTLQYLRTALNLPPIAARTRATAGCCDVESYDVEMLRSILSEADREVSAWGGQLVFIAIPDNAHFVDAGGRFCRPCASTPDLDSLLTARHRAIEIARTLGIKVVDLHEPLLAHVDQRLLFPYPGGHFSVTGYAIVARAITAALRESVPVPFRQRPTLQ